MLVVIETRVDRDVTEMVQEVTKKKNLVTPEEREPFLPKESRSDKHRETNCAWCTKGSTAIY